MGQKGLTIYWGQLEMGFGKSLPRGSVDGIFSAKCDRERHPIRLVLIDSFKDWQNCYLSLDDNFKKSPLLFNPLFVYGRNNVRMLDNAILGNYNTPEFSEIFAKVTYEDVTTVAVIKVWTKLIYQLVLRLVY